MRILSIALRIAFALYAGLAVSALGARPAAAVRWSNPHHAYVIFDRVKGKEHQPYIRILALDKKSPSHVLSGAKTGLATGMPAALAVGPQGNLYVSGLFSGPSFVPEILIYAPGAFGNVAPIAMIAGSATRLNNPRGIAFGRAGNLYVADSSNEGGRQAAIDVYAVGATGNVAPIARITGSQTHLMSGNLIAIAVDDAGEVFAGQDIFAGQVVKFAAGASGNAAPLAIANVSRASPLTELSTSGNTVYVPVRRAPGSQGRRLQTEHGRSFTSGRRARRKVAFRTCGPTLTVRAGSTYKTSYRCIRCSFVSSPPAVASPSACNPTGLSSAVAVYRRRTVIASAHGVTEI